MHDFEVTERLIKRLEILYSNKVNNLKLVKNKFNHDYNFLIYKIYNEKFHYSRYANNEEYKIISHKDYKLIYKIENN